MLSVLAGGILLEKLMDGTRFVFLLRGERRSSNQKFNISVFKDINLQFIISKEILQVISSNHPHHQTQPKINKKRIISCI